MTDVSKMNGADIIPKYKPIQSDKTQVRNTVADAYKTADSYDIGERLSGKGSLEPSDFTKKFVEKQVAKDMAAEKRDQKIHQTLLNGLKIAGSVIAAPFMLTGCSDNNFVSASASAEVDLECVNGEWDESTNTCKAKDANGDSGIKYPDDNDPQGPAQSSSSKDPEPTSSSSSQGPAQSSSSQDPEPASSSSSKEPNSSSSTPTPNDSKVMVKFSGYQEWDYVNRSGELNAKESTESKLVYDVKKEDDWNNKTTYEKITLADASGQYTVTTKDGKTLKSPDGQFVERYDCGEKQGAKLEDCNIKEKAFIQDKNDTLHYYKGVGNKEYAEKGTFANHPDGSIETTNMIGTEDGTKVHITNQSVETATKDEVNQMIKDAKKK